jgi:triacylglycerol lipase
MDVRNLVDPAYRSLVEAMAANAVDWSNPAKVRADRRALMPPAPIPDTVAWADHDAPGPEGSPSVMVRLYRPAGATGTLPCVYWIHGGGYMGGTADGANETASDWALDLQCAVASVEYRLAPENPYPAPLEDCYAGLHWLIHNAGELKIDPGRVVIGGGSAGGGLCAGLALLARDRGELSVSGQLLVYPMIDDRRSLPSSQWETWVWTKQSNETGWKAYLGELFGGPGVPAYAAASRASDLAGLPPAYIAVGSLDLFLSEDIDYAHRLLQAGVPTELHIYAGGPHGFDAPALGGKSELGGRARADMKTWLRGALA